MQKDDMVAIQVWGTSMLMALSARGLSVTTMHPALLCYVALPL